MRGKHVERSQAESPFPEYRVKFIIQYRKIVDVSDFLDAHQEGKEPVAALGQNSNRRTRGILRRTAI